MWRPHSNALVLRMKVKEGNEMPCSLQDRLGDVFLYFLTFLHVYACVHVCLCAYMCTCTCTQVCVKIGGGRHRNNYQEEKTERVVSG